MKMAGFSEEAKNFVHIPAASTGFKMGERSKAVKLTNLDLDEMAEKTAKIKCHFTTGCQNIKQEIFTFNMLVDRNCRLT